MLNKVNLDAKLKKSERNWAMNWVKHSVRQEMQACR